MRRLIVIVLAVLFCVGVPLTAFADNCKNLEKDKVWTEGFKKLNDLITAKNWEEALNEGHKLYAYCDRSPLINFYLGHIYQEMGNEKNALNYLRKATDNTDEFKVTGPVLERIWYERYEAEHPEARPESIAKMKEALKAEQEKVLAVKDEKKQSEFDSALSLEKVRANYAAGLWTGVGLAGAGLVLGGVGAWMIATDDVLKYGDRITVKRSYGIGWSLLGAGIAATVSGVVIAGIMGHHYAQLNKQSEVSFGISPFSAELTIVF